MMLTELARHFRDQGHDAYRDVRLDGASGRPHAPDLFCEKGEDWLLVYAHANRPVTAADVVDAHVAAFDCGAAAACYSPLGASPEARRWATRFRVTIVDAEAVAATRVAHAQRTEAAVAHEEPEGNAPIPLPASSLHAQPAGFTVEDLRHLVALSGPVTGDAAPAATVWPGVVDARAVLMDAFAIPAPVVPTREAPSEPTAAPEPQNPLPWPVPAAEADDEDVDATPDSESPLPWPVPTNRAATSDARPSDEALATQGAFLWKSFERLRGLHRTLELEGANSFGEGVGKDARASRSDWLRSLVGLPAPATRDAA